MEDAVAVRRVVGVFHQPGRRGAGGAVGGDLDEFVDVGQAPDELLAGRRFIPAVAGFDEAGAGRDRQRKKTIFDENLNK